jgi:N6-adenosine-specific RNA methylase IME4
VAPEHKRLNRYGTLTLDDIKALPVAEAAAETAHLYLWVPNALLPDGLAVLDAWGFKYKSNIVWQKVRKDGGPDGRGVGFYFRNVTEILLFGTRGKNARTLQPGRTQVNIMNTRKREHSRKPDEQYPLITSCSQGTSPGNVRPRQKRGLGNLGQPGRRKLLTGLANLRESLAVRSSAATRFGLGRIAINGQVLFRLLLNLGLIER